MSHSSYSFQRKLFNESIISKSLKYARHRISNKSSKKNNKNSINPIEVISDKIDYYIDTPTDAISDWILPVDDNETDGLKSKLKNRVDDSFSDKLRVLDKLKQLKDSMIKFRQKECSIKDGYYTGPKDLDKVPGAFDIIGKGAIGGSIIGGIVGKLSKNDRDSGFDDDYISKGAKVGGLAGVAGGIALKLFLNHLHNPMKEVEYKEVDRHLRREFGMYRVGGVVVGDSISNRATLSDKFSFDDRNVTDYKINIAIANNKVVLYTFGASDEDIKKLDSSLDNYCKKYQGMKYSSKLINPNMNSYSVDITFTNYQVIANFIMEISNSLMTKINLLNDGASIVLNRLKDYREWVDNDSNDEDVFETPQQSSKLFSSFIDSTRLNKSSIASILSQSGYEFLNKSMFQQGSTIKGCASAAILKAMVAAAKSIKNNELVRLGAPASRYKFGTSYLKSTLDKLYYTKGLHYTIGDKNSPNNFSMSEGRFFITIAKNSKDRETVDSKFWNGLKSVVHRNDLGEVISYTYTIKSREEFEMILKKLMSTKVKFNLFEA